MPSKENQEKVDWAQWWSENISVFVLIEKYHVHLLNAMVAEGGKGILIDDSFIQRHNIDFRPKDPRELITDIQYYGFIRAGRKGGWDITAKGRNWLAGKIRVRQGLMLRPVEHDFSGWLYFGNRSVDDVLNDNGNEVAGVSTKPQEAPAIA